MPPTPPLSRRQWSGWQRIGAGWVVNVQKITHKEVTVQSAKNYVQVNEHGRRIGESHPRAKLTDHEIDLIRELAEEGMSYAEIAAKFDMKPNRASRSRISHIVACRRRGQTPAKVKRVAAR